MKRSPIQALKNPSRRDLLKMAGGCAALTNTSLLSTLMNLSATNQAVAANQDATPFNDYKALVCVFLWGGNDSYNMLTPMESDQRTDYLAARGGVYAPNNGALGLDAATLHTITDSETNFDYGLHPSSGSLQQLYLQNKLTCLCNVGSLVRPTSRQQYNQGSDLPLGLFSHADLQQHWMTSVPQTRSQVTGWGGRMADLLSSRANSNTKVSMNISLGSVNMLQTGGQVVPYVVQDSGATEVWMYGNANWNRSRIFTTLTDDALTMAYGNLVEKTFAEANSNAIEAAVDFNQQVNDEFDARYPTESEQTEFNNLFPNTNFGRQMRMVAKSIAAQSRLQQSRQTFFVGLGGWDNHGELINTHAGLMQTLADGLNGFQTALGDLGKDDEVVTFTASDFARTLNSNGRGSDHAWGGNQIIMGNPVQGGRLYGEYPTSLAPGNELDLGRGRLLPTHSVDQFAAELALWYGVPNDQCLEDMLPNIRNFFAADAVGSPFGMLG
ncbi:MAG: DUF1501 domain-containing protein [Planctomycetota bacterium]